MQSANKNVFEKLINLMAKTHNTGWIKSHRGGVTGIGKTLEDVLGIKENNKMYPDFQKSIELKATKIKTSSKVTLLTKSPDGSSVNSGLRTKFGSKAPNAEYPTLYTTIKGNRWNSYKKKHRFRLSVDRKSGAINILRKSYKGHKVTVEATYKTKDVLDAMQSKLNYMVVTLADHKKIDGEDWYSYKESKFYQEIDRNKILDAIEDGRIVIDFRLGVSKSQKDSGKNVCHDHGTGFRVSRKYIDSLYKKVEKMSA